jgi:hypothetical protein
MLGKLLKRIWEAVSTGWVLEYPDSDHGPKDFFDRRHNKTDGQELETPPAYQDSGIGISREDAVFKWSEQIKAAKG